MVTYRPAKPASIARRMASQFWGGVQVQRKTAPGIWWFSTAGHGGYVVDTAVRPALQEFNSEVTRNGQCYCDEQHFAAFEEDCMAAIVEWTYPEILPAVFEQLVCKDNIDFCQFKKKRIELLRSSLARWNPAWLSKCPTPGAYAQKDTEE